MVLFACGEGYCPNFICVYDKLFKRMCGISHTSFFAAEGVLFVNFLPTLAFWLKMVYTIKLNLLISHFLPDI